MGEVSRDVDPHCHHRCSRLMDAATRVMQRFAIHKRYRKGRTNKEGKMPTEKQIEAIARACHEANRSWCLLHGDMSQPSWGMAPAWQRSSARKGVRGALDGNTPEQSHECWLEEKEATGWVYGQVKDPEAKTHPCMVPYAELPPEQRAKDHLFTGTVQLFAAALGL